MNLKELQSDYIDAILIHGTPGVEQMTVEQCMEVQGELAKARDKGLVRFVGFSALSLLFTRTPCRTCVYAKVIIPSQA